jgi:alanyl-tRNA synthetase
MLPSNEGRGYVLRRIMRRAIRFGRSIDIGRHFLSQVISRVIANMSSAYPHLVGSLNLQIEVANNEEDRFLETLDKGLEMLNDEITRLQKSGEATVPGDFTFKLYDTYGFPVDIIRDVALEHSLTVDEVGFNVAMEAQRAQSKKSWKGTGLETMTAGVKALVDEGHKALFVGYAGRDAESVITGMINASGDPTGRNCFHILPGNTFLRRGRRPGWR